MYIACRTKARAEDAIADLQKDIVQGAEVHFVECDLSKFESVRSCAKELLECVVLPLTSDIRGLIGLYRKEKRIDVLINNACVDTMSIRFASFQRTSLSVVLPLARICSRPTALT